MPVGGCCADSSHAQTVGQWNRRNLFSLIVGSGFGGAGASVRRPIRYEPSGELLILLGLEYLRVKVWRVLLLLLPLEGTPYQFRKPLSGA